MIYKASRKLTFVVYENQQPSKCFEIKKSTIRFFIFFAPIVLIFCLITVIFSLAQIRHVTKETLLVHKEEVKGQELSDLKIKTDELLKEKEEISKLNTELLDKINSKGLSGLNPLVIPFFNPVQGALDLSKNKEAGIQDEKLQIDKDNIHFTFNIVNNRKDGAKLSGHIAVLLKSAALSVIYPYPKDKVETNKPIYMTFNMGESFSTSRFRPVDATFNLSFSKLSAPLFFDVIIFSKTGDLLLRQSVGPLNASNSNDA